MNCLAVATLVSLAAKSKHARSLKGGRRADFMCQAMDRTSRSIIDRTRRQMIVTLDRAAVFAQDITMASRSGR